jgi:hypothetical protein
MSWWWSSPGSAAPDEADVTRRAFPPPANLFLVDESLHE